MILKEQIEHWHAQPASTIDGKAAARCFEEFKTMLNQGAIRSAEPVSAPGTPGGWRVNDWVKKGILLGFRLGILTEVSINEEFRYFDKHTFPLKTISAADGIRLVPGGSSIRDGCFVAKNVVMMPPSYINVGAFVDEGTMIDSH